MTAWLALLTLLTVSVTAAEASDLTEPAYVFYGRIGFLEVHGMVCSASQPFTLQGRFGTAEFFPSDARSGVYRTLGVWENCVYGSSGSYTITPINGRGDAFMRYTGGETSCTPANSPPISPPVADLVHLHAAAACAPR